MKEISLTRGLVALVDDEDFEMLSPFRWCADEGYATRNDYTEGKHRKYKMHRVILGLASGDVRVVDHIDGNGLNNCRSNLRICSVRENSRNRGAQKNNRSGYKGVSWFASCGKWRARIDCDGKQKFLGHFDTAEEAHEAYKKAAAQYHGDFANCGA